MKKLKLSISNLILIIVCIVVLITVLILNAVNSRSLISLRQSIDTLVIQNPSIGLLQETDKQLSIAENNYRIYLSNYDSTYREAFLTRLSQIQFNLQQIKSSEDSADVNQILSGLDKKMQLADMVAELKMIADSVTIHSRISEKKGLAQLNGPLKVKKIDKSIIESFVINRVDTLKAVPKKKRGFFKKLGELFTSKTEEVPLQYAKGGTTKEGQAIDSTSKESVTDSSVTKLSEAIQKFYQGSVNKEMNLRKRLNEGEKTLAETNLKIIAEIDAALEILLQKEMAARKQHLVNAMITASQARESISRFSWGSFVIILLIIVLLSFNIYRLIKYESKLIIAREDAEKMTQVKSRFLSNMSHEIRSPLTSIMGFTDIIDRLETDPEKKKYLQAIRTSSDHLLHTVNDVLDFSKLDAGKLKLELRAFNIAEAIHEVAFAFTAAAAEKGIEIREELAVSKDLIVIGDKFRLKQILFNLTSNAIKFTEKGAVVITAELSSRSDQEAYIRIRVADSGIGIPQNQLGSIFEEFTQVTSQDKSNESRRAIRGTGLGLPICKMLAELQGGNIEVQSKINEGSVFTVSLLYQVDKKTKADEVVLAAVQKTNSEQLFVDKKALVIEDNEMNAMLLGLLLKKQQLPFDLAKDGQAGWDLFNKNQYDIVLTDINVPKMTGDQLATAIRNHPNGKSAMPVIALTATIVQDDLDAYRKAGISDILVKPFKESELKAMLLKHLYPES
ncbi:MAG: response regulator [Chitinophagaceae bacterium]|nr:response regulator [Chitinophagaceae bacterium]